MKKIELCASAVLLGTLVLENINVEGMEPLKPLNLTGGNGSTLSATSLASVDVPSNISTVAAVGQENANGIEQTAPAAQETTKTKEVQPLDQYTMMVISKYFNTVNDYINIEKCCKEYNGIMNLYHFNPIPFQTRQERELFKRIETYHFYGKNDKKNWIEEDTRIKKRVHWEEKISYLDWKEDKKGNRAFTNVEFGQDDMKKYPTKEKIILEDGITSLGDECFKNCYNLSSVTIPTTVSSLGSHCFKACRNLSTISIPSSVSSLGKLCFYGCKRLTSINIPTSVSSLGNSCFVGCLNLKTISIPSSVSSLGNLCFAYCSNLSTITIPTSVSYLGSGCFTNCPNLSTITIPTSVSFLGNYCFSDCSNLSTITIPTSVSYIRNSCFNSCRELSTISTQQENTDQLKNLLPDELKEKVKGENQQKEEGKK